LGKKTVTGASLILSFFFQKMGILLILKHGFKKNWNGWLSTKLDTQTLAENSQLPK